MMQDNDAAMNDYAPYMYPGGMGHSGNMVSMTDPEEILERLEKHFQGKVERPDGTWEKKYDALLNDEGINNLMFVVRSVVSRITFMSNLEEEQIIDSMNYLADTLIEDLLQNKHEYDIDTDTDRNRILFGCLFLAFTSMRRGYKEGDKRFFKGSSMEVNYGQVGSQPMQQGGKTLNPMSWWK